MNKPIGLKRGTVQLKKWNPKWKSLFEIEKELLLDTFGKRILAIEHIGSTAITDLSAKPIIDINVAVKSLNNIDDFIQQLPKLGYEYILERSFTDRQFFPKGPRENRTHHLNLVEITSESGWENPLLLRDYLRKNEKVKSEYENLKIYLSEKYHNDRVRYTQGKEDFILKVINNARRNH